MTFSHAVVTGASSGIGKAIAERLVADGNGVIGLARRFDRRSPPTSPKIGELSKMSLDVSDEAAVSEFFDSLEHIDLLVNCAGGGVFRSLEESRAAEFRTLFEAHVMGTYFCSMAAFRKMKSQRCGRIVVLSSISTDNAFVNCGAYSAAKAGQYALANVLREECRGFGIGVTTVIAGATDTPIWDDRPAFDRKQMMTAQSVANTLVDAIAKDQAAPDELKIMPAAGIL